MPPKGEEQKGTAPAEKKNKKEKIEKLPSVEKFPSLVAILEGGGDVIEEYELERRYLPARLLTEEELKQYETRNISQTFVSVRDQNGNKVTFRLRVTHQSGEEGVLLRIARKTPIGDLFGKQERQLQFKPDDPRAKEHGELWKLRDTRVINRQRYYIPHTFKGDGRDIECAIHYEVWKDKEEKGFVRIEIEFKNDEDELYYEAHKDEGLLPDWVGRDVTGESAYLAKTITKNGLPEEAYEHIKALQAA